MAHNHFKLGIWCLTKRTIFNRIYPIMADQTSIFLAEIEQFLNLSPIDATALGKGSLGDPNFVFDLRNGRSPSARTMDKVRAWIATQKPKAKPMIATDRLTHLQKLEAESIHSIREVAAECEKPVMLYSIGKDSAVMLHLAMKAFYPAKPPFPLMHVDTTWKFREMIQFRDETVKRLGLKLLVHTNEDGVKRGINPFDSGSALHTQVMKTEALKQALDKYGFDAAFGGARRDEEKSRAKERVFSFRSPGHVWDPRNQRPELWNLYNTRINKGETIRVFPLSNWTELDIWQYTREQEIPIVPLYLAAPRAVVL